MSIRRAVRKLINKAGYDVRRLSAQSPAMRTTLAEMCAQVRGVGFEPRTVVDVGVAAGTGELYRTFADAYFLLIEPLGEFESNLKSILAQYNGSYMLAAAGARPGQVTFNVHKHDLDGSSLYKSARGTDADGSEVTVPVVRIDDVVRDKELAGPYFIKADVQGAELDALDGAQETLTQTEVVVLEVSLFEFLKGAPQLFDVVSYMKERGFVVYDVILGRNRPLDNALAQVDIAFVKEDGMFRQIHRYA